MEHLFASNLKSDRILRAALHLFSAHGYHGTSMQHIATEAGVSKGLLFHHFADKSSLLHALIETLQQHLAPQTPISVSQEPAEAFHALIEHVFGHLTQAHALVKLLVPLAIHIGGTESFHQLMTQKMQGIQTYLADLLRQMDVAQPEMEAQQLALLLDGLQLRIAIDPKYAPVNEIKAAVLAKYL
ncbi:MAG: TetR/AcrR family transcriptional regulator [Schleiferiaceae bacterium]|jgi:AcrR family transcriptional regulator